MRTRAFGIEIEKQIISAKLIQAERINGCLLQMPSALRQEMKADGAALGGCLPSSRGSHVLGSVSNFRPKWFLSGRGFGPTYPGSAPFSCQRIIVSSSDGLEDGANDVYMHLLWILYDTVL